MWCAVISIWLHELGDFVVAFKCNFYFGVPEEVCDFSDLWGYVCGCLPLGFVFGSCGWCCMLGYSLLYLLS